MKQLLSFLLCGAMASALAPAHAGIADVSWSQDDATKSVTVSYKLTGTEALIVTLDVLTNGVSIGAANLSHVTGDANMFVQPSDTATRTIAWQPSHAWRLDEATVTIKVVGWPKHNPPDYMAIPLAQTTANPANIRYYTGEGALPGTITNECWRIDWLLMRHIRAAGQSFIMGSPITEQYRNATLNSGAHERFNPSSNVPNAGCLPETPHPVSFSNDYFIAVFSPTWGQMDFITGNYGAQKGTAWATVKTMNMGYGYSWNTVRGANTKPSGTPAADSYLGKLRTLTGLDFDLPTEAQWEYACRAGTQTPFNDGVNYSDYYYSRNFGMATKMWCCNHPNWPTDHTTPPAGSFPANRWGLYDMHGGWGEWCLDDVTDAVFPTEPVVDPVGTDTTKGWKARRSGTDDLWAPQARSASRVGVYPEYTIGMTFRPVCPAVVPVPASN